MRVLRSPFLKVLLIVLSVGLVSALAVFAAPRGASTPSVLCELGQQTAYRSESAPTLPVIDDCCVAPGFFGTTPQNTLAAFRNAPADGICCLLPSLFRATAHSTTMAAFPDVAPTDPCLPAPNNCNLALPDGSVVGDLPYDQQAFWAPGKISPDVIVNAGTYWVTGVGTADNGDQYYQIVVACQYLWVPIDSMQPSYQAPWSGQPLPTNSVT